MENGPEELPLLGPRAAGSYLRLGPIFYYFQFISAKIFNSVEPHAVAFPDLFFSILTIPLLYYFLRNFFARFNAVCLTAIYTFSFIAIQYSRFAWNPNSLPFWGILFLTALHKAVSSKKRKRAGQWLLLAALAFSIASQLHFMSLMIFSLVAVIYLLIHRPRIKIGYWLGAVAVVMVFYLPMFFSEFQTKGDNWKQFSYAMLAKSSQEELPARIYYVQQTEKMADNLSLFLLSWQSQHSKLSVYFGIFLAVSGTILLAYYWKKKENKRPFVSLVFLVFVITILACYKADASLKPRFFFPIFFMPLFFLGLYFLLTEKIFKGGIAKILIVLVSGIAIILNLQAVGMWYSYLENQDINAIKRGFYLKQSNGVTLEKMKAAAYYAAEKAKENKKLLCFYTNPKYRRSVEYVLSLKYSEDFYDRISHSMKTSKKEKCQFFSINPTLEKDVLSERYEISFSVKDREGFGLMSVWNLEPKPIYFDYEKIKDLREKEEDEDENKEEMKEEKEEKDDDELEKPRRKERVFWGDVAN